MAPSAAQIAINAVVRLRGGWLDGGALASSPVVLETFIMFKLGRLRRPS